MKIEVIAEIIRVLFAVNVAIWLVLAALLVAG